MVENPAALALSSSLAPFPWLLADVGGSNARFAWMSGPGQAPQHVRTLAVAEYPQLVDAARAYLNGLAVSGLIGAADLPASAALAVATAVTGDAVRFTNSAWSFSQQHLADQLALHTLVVLNDFEALALSLPRLRPEQVQGAPLARPVAPMAVVGPGTGLGVAGLLPHQRPGGAPGVTWLAIPGEGGHATLAPADDFEASLLSAARAEFPHVSAERFLSGIGLPVLYRAVAQVSGQRAVPGVDGKWIVERALADDDALSAQTLDTFCAMLGGFAGSVALTFGARGGVYIGGGIVPRLGERFARSAFRQRFEAKGRFSGFLQPIATPVITDTLAALDGAAQALTQLG
jgi:glucokinase